MRNARNKTTIFLFERTLLQKALHNPHFYYSRPLTTSHSSILLYWKLGLNACLMCDTFPLSSCSFSEVSFQASWFIMRNESNKMLAMFAHSQSTMKKAQNEERGKTRKIYFQEKYTKYPYITALCILACYKVTCTLD